MDNIERLFRIYISKRPLFLSLIRAKEAELYQRYLPLKKPVLDIGAGDGFFASILFTPLKVRPFKVLFFPNGTIETRFVYPSYSDLNPPAGGEKTD